MEIGKIVCIVGRVNKRGNNLFLDFKKALVFKCEIYMDRNQNKKIVKIRAPRPRSFSRAKNLGGPLGPPKKCLQIGVS